MPSIREMAEGVLEENEEDELLDHLSDNEDEDIDALEAPIEPDLSFPHTVVVCNLPIVPEAKKSKLEQFMKKFVDKYGDDNEKVMPMNTETGMTQGFIIVTFFGDDAAKSVKMMVEQMNGIALDKSHKAKVVPMDQFDEIVDRSDEFIPQRNISSFSRSDFRDWLGDKKCREQILIRYQNETEIHWHDTLVGMPVLAYGGEREKAQKKVWCDWRVQWSPQGSYIATFHAQGIAIWAGPDFEKKARLPLARVKEIQFSPNEEYVLLWNGQPHSENSTEPSISIFHVLTSRCVKTLRTPSYSPGGEEFPHFLWSADGKFIADCTESRITVRDVETWEVIKDSDGKRTALKFDSLKTFQWSPKDNIIAVWTLEKDNNPARLVLVEIPTRREIASRSRTSCEAEMFWQSEGDYLCLSVTKLSKTKKRVATNLEIFRIRDKSIPVDIVTIEDHVKGFFWETKGNRFAVLTADEAGHKPKLLIYELAKEKCEEVCCFELPSNSFNKVIWAPEGQYFIVASVSVATGASSSGDLLFAGMTADNKLEILHKDEHYMLTNVQWDPSSRYVITSVTQPMQDAGGFKFTMEAGWAIWTFQGRELYKQQKEKLWDVQWRPHPPSLLTNKKQDEIRKNIKKFSKQYDAMDDQAKNAARTAFQNERREKTNAFLDVLARLSDFKADKMENNSWEEAMNTFAEEQEWSEEKHTHEEELGVQEELVG